MEVKTFEVRDRATFIPVMCVKCSPMCEEERYLLACSGFGINIEAQSQYVILTRLSDLKSTFVAEEWDGITISTAHRYITKHFDELNSGSVIDAEFIRGETPRPVRSQACHGLLT